MDKVFISYSHEDEIWKDILVKQLNVLGMDGLLDVWEDRRIKGGDDWYVEIEAAMEAAKIAVLLISADFLTSEFILGEEVPRLLERRRKEGLRVIPLIVRPCTWYHLNWLKQIQAWPKDGKPLSGGNKHQIEEVLEKFVSEILDLTKGIEPVKKKCPPPLIPFNALPG